MHRAPLSLTLFAGFKKLALVAAAALSSPARSFQRAREKETLQKIWINSVWKVEGVHASSCHAAIPPGPGTAARKPVVSFDKAA